MGVERSGTLKLEPALRATLEQRLTELEVAQTLQASPTATIKPAPRSSTDAWTRPEPSTLPQIALAGEAIDLELRALLGEGGMGRVHSAFQRSLSREVAIKTLRENPSPGASAALLREAVLTGTLEHPGVVPVHALGLDPSGAPVLVMKRIEGVQWGELMHDPGHAAWEGRPGDRLVTHLEILMQVCQTVHFAHKRRILHRDIKPENVMLGEFGEAYLVDWGIALRLDPGAPSGASSLAGTPAYMAPEMVQGGVIDERTDVFLLGATLHEALTGELRNRGDTLESVLVSALSCAPYTYDASVPAEVAAICNRATARAPDERFPSALALREAIVEHLRHRGSVKLAEQAAERCAALSALMGETEGAPADLNRAHQLANETRFAYTAALREWPENRDARRGLTSCVTLLVDLELRQGHLATADALILELESPPAALSERLARAREARDRNLADQARLASLDRDHDSRVASRPRALLLGTFAIGGMGASALTLSAAGELRTRSMLLFAASFLVLSLVAVALFRRVLLQNAFNRRAVALLVLATAAMTASRVVAVMTQMTVPRTAAQDLLVLSAVAAAGAVTMMRWLWIVVPALLIALVYGMFVPERAVVALAIAVGTVPALGVYVFWRERPAP